MKNYKEDLKMEEKTQTAITIREAADDLKDKIARRIRASFVELVPEDAWTTMVQTELNAFTAKPERRSTDREETRSPLTQLIHDELHERFRELIKTELSKDEYQGAFDGWGNSMASQAVAGIVQKAIPEIVTAAVGGLAQRIVDRLRQDLASGNRLY